MSMAACGGEGYTIGEIPNTTSANQPVGVPPTSGNSNSTSGSSCTADTWTNYIQATWQANCLACHGPGFTPDLTSYTATVAAATDIETQLRGNLMPPGSPLDAADTARVIKWIDCMTPQ